MFEASGQPIRSMVLRLRPHPQSQTDLDILNLAQGLIYDGLQATHGLSQSWDAFVNGGSVDDVFSRAVTAYCQSDWNSDGQALWAIRFRVRHPENKRRNWLTQIGLRRHSENLLTLYYAKSYSDYMVGSFSDPRALAVPPDDWLDDLLANPYVQCFSGTRPLAVFPIELRHSTMPEFISELNDNSRTVPLVLICCPAIVNPDDLLMVSKGNIIVYWCDHPSTVTRLNGLLPRDLSVEQDSVRVYLPMDGEHRFHPSFAVTDIIRMTGDGLIAKLFQAYCQDLRSENRRAFVTVEDIGRIHMDRGAAIMRARLSDSQSENRDLALRNEQLSQEAERLRTQVSEFAKQKPDDRLKEYEELLNEALTETEILREGIASLSASLFTDLGKTFKPDANAPAILQELAHAIYASIARATEKK